MGLAVRQATSLFVVILVVVGLAVYSYQQAYQSCMTKIDFGPYIVVANRMRDKDPVYVFNKDRLYTTEQYLYPPLPAFLFRGCAGLNLYKAGHVWIAVNIAILILVGALYCWTVGIKPLRDLALLLLIAIASFRNYPTQLEISIGNVDLIILLCLVGVMALSKFERWRQAAVLISVAASIKTWAIAFTIYFLFLRKIKAAILAVAIFAIATAGMFAVLGLDEFETFVKIQRAYTYQPKLNSNSIIPVCRLYSGRPQLEHHHVEMPFNGADTIMPIVGVLAFILIAAAFLVIGWRFARSNQSQAKFPLLMGFSIITCLLLNPVCHQYYYVFALPVIWNLIVYADSKKRVGKIIEEDWLGMAMWTGALIAFLLLLVPSPGLIEPNAITGYMTEAPFGYAQTLIAGLILWLTTAATLIFDQSGKTDDNKMLLSGNKTAGESNQQLTLA